MIREVPPEVAMIMRANFARYGVPLLVREDVAPQPEPEDQRLERELCLGDFRHFLRYWRFVNRETGRILSFENLWPGQEEAVDLMLQEQWLYLLKAGKLGFTQLETAYDGWVALSRPNARVHLFSRVDEAAKELLGYVRFGLARLPEWLRLPILEQEAGGNTTKSLKLLAGPDDIRTIVSYPTKAGVAIEQSATHSHVDELSHMADPEGVWGSVATTVPDGGSVHIVTRGAGRDVYTAQLWDSCYNQGGSSQLYGHFAPWDRRPDRTIEYREQQRSTMPLQALLFYLPETVDDALAGDDTRQFVPLEAWDQCLDHALVGPIDPAKREPVVIALDAGISGDCAAAVIVSRHPDRHGDPAIRGVHIWRPDQFEEGRIQLRVMDEFVREACRHLNVVQVCYDPYQLEDICQRLRLDSVVWADPFNQQGERLISDGQLRQMVMQKRLAHNGDPILREHVGNAVARVAKGEDTRLRIEKRAPATKIDAAVAASMGCKRVLDLNL